jgi:release factor glutamine methyltransferase
MTETELLFTEVLSCSRPELYLNKNLILGRDKTSYIASVLRRRFYGEPIHYILGKTEFMGLEFKVGPETLIPRPETEILVEASIQYVGRLEECKGGDGGARVKILDLCTGSGCIAVALAKLLPDVDVTATDISSAALEIARDNAKAHNVAEKIGFVNCDLFTGLRGAGKGSFDIVVSNPPYIPAAEIATLQPEISYEPRIALDGGNDGLDFYRRIISQAALYLKKNGFLILEMGCGQKEDIENIFQKTEKFEIIDILKDYNSRERVCVATHTRNLTIF